MALPEVSTTVIDGALGLNGQSDTAVSATIGVGAGGTPNTIVKVTRPRDATTGWTAGPLVEKLAYHIYHSGEPVYASSVTASVAGVAGSVTKSNVSGPTVVVSGAPRDTYDVTIEITQTGEIGDETATGAFRYTVDGGDAYTPELALPTGGARTAATRTGTASLAGGGLYGGGGTLDTLTVIGSIDNGSVTTCTFSAPADKAAAVAQLNAAFDGSPFTAPGNFLIITSPTTGLTSEIDITGGTALTALGLTIATTTGTAPAGSYSLSGTGMTLAFPQGTYTDGETYAFTTTEPNYSLSNLSDALDVFVANNQITWFCLHVIGAAATAADARAMADLLDTYASDFEDVHRFMFFVMETPASATEADLKAEFADFESTRVAVSYGYCELTSEATRDGVKRVFSRPSAWPAVARWASVELSEKAAFVGRGKLPGVQSVDDDTLAAAEEMSDARFLAIREVIGKSGYYLAEDNIMAPPGSDFAIVPYRRIMDVGCATVRKFMLEHLQGKLLVDATTGFIRESTAKAIEDGAESRLDDALTNKGHASDAWIVVDRADNLLQTPRLDVETRIIPPGYARDIAHTIGFINPAFSQTT